MCGTDKLIYKNVVVGGRFVDGVFNSQVHISVPFAPDQLQVTYLSVTHSDDSPPGSIFNLYCDQLTNEPLAQLTTNNSFQQYSQHMGGIHTLPNFSNGFYTFRLSGIFDNAPPADGSVLFSLNLRFSRKLQ